MNNCPNCHEQIDDGAAFCGNCGQAVATPVPGGGMPAYAHTTAQRHIGETKALVSLLAGVTGIVGAFFIPVIGILFGIGGVIIGTMSQEISKRKLSAVGIAVASLAVLAGLANSVYAARHVEEVQQARDPNAVVASTVSTDCYSTGFIDHLNVVHDTESCSSSAYNAATVEDSTNAYRVFASKTGVTDTGSFTVLAKQALEADVRENLPDYVIDSQRVAGFAGSPAYTVHAYNKKTNVAVVETAVYHPVKTGDNVFILVHAVSDDTADLEILEAQWQWK